MEKVILRYSSAVGIYQINRMLRIKHAFTAYDKPPSVPKGHYEPSTARERFYDLFADVILDKNDGIDKDEICKAVDYMKS